MAGFITNVTADRLMVQVRAEDWERDRIEDELKSAQSYVNVYIDRNPDMFPLEDDEQIVYDRAVLFVAADSYMNGAGGSKNTGTTRYTGINANLDMLKRSELGSEPDGTV